MEDLRILFMGTRLDIKGGVRIKEVNWYVLSILAVYQQVCAEMGVIGAVTGGWGEAVYENECDHREGRALDLRSSVFREPKKIASVLQSRLRKLDTAFIVLYLNEGSGFHFHAAWRGGHLL